MGKTRDTGNLVDNTSGTNTGDQSLSGYQTTSGKDATGGYAGLTLFKINFKNALDTFTSFFTNANTAARTYTFQNRDGTIADDTDLGLKQNKSLSAYSFIANNTSGTANGTENVYKDIAEQTYAGTITPTAGLAPSGTPTHTYSWMQIGNGVLLRMNLKWSVAGTTVTQLSMPMPTDMPNPKIPAGYTGANAFLYRGAGYSLTNITSVSTSVNMFITRNSGDSNFNVIATCASNTLTGVIMEIFYLTT